MNLTITPSLLERAGRARAKSPCGASVKHGRMRADVAFRESHDSYDVYSDGGQWVASFSDVSVRGQTVLENLTSAGDAKIRYRGFPKGGLTVTKA